MRPGHRTTAATPALASPATALAVLVVTGVLAAFQVGRVAAAIPQVRAETGASLSTAGWLLSGYSLVGALGGVLLGDAARRVGLQRALLIGILIMAAGSTAGAAAPGIGLLLATRVLESLGFTVIVVSVPSLLAMLAGPNARTMALGIWGTYLPAGQALGFAVSPLLLHVAGWRVLWLANAAVLMLWLIPVGAVLHHTNDLNCGSGERPVAASSHAVRVSLACRNVRLLAPSFGVYALQYLAVVGFLPEIYTAHGVNSGLSALFTALITLGNVAGNVAAGFALRYLRSSSLLAAGAGVMAVAELIHYHGGLPLAASLAVAVTFTSFGGLIPATCMASVPEVAPSVASTAAVNGLLVQAANIDTLAGPPLVAVVAARTGGWQFSPLILVPASTAGLLLGLALHRAQVVARPGNQSTSTIGRFP